MLRQAAPEKLSLKTNFAAPAEIVSFLRTRNSPVISLKMAALVNYGAAISGQKVAVRAPARKVRGGKGGLSKRRPVSSVPTPPPLLGVENAGPNSPHIRRAGASCRRGAP